jgi:hypothetical protein
MALATKKGTFNCPTAVTNPFTVSGVGFQPLAVILWSAFNTAEGNGVRANSTFGIATGSTQRVTLAGCSDDAVAASNTGKTSRTTAAFVGLSNGTPTVDCIADFVAFTADGFQLNYSDAAGVANQVVHYFAIGGTDLSNAFAGSWTIVRTTAGTEATTGVGFMPDAVLFFSATFAAPTTAVDDQISIGYAIRQTGEQGSIYWFDNDATTAIDLARYQNSTHCLALAAATAVTEGTATMSSFDSDGFTLNWDDPVSAASRVFYYLALKGGNYKGGVGTQPATNTTTTHTTGFQPKGTLVFGTDATADGQTSVNGDRMFMFGASDRGSQGTPAEGVIANVNRDDSATAANAVAKKRHLTSATATMIKTSGTSIVTAGDASLTATSTNDFTLTWTGVDATQRQFFWLAFGDTPPPPVPPVFALTAETRT